MEIFGGLALLFHVHQYIQVEMAKLKELEEATQLGN